MRGGKGSGPGPDSVRARRAGSEAPMTIETNRRAMGLCSPRACERKGERERVRGEREREQSRELMSRAQMDSMRSTGEFGVSPPSYMLVLVSTTRQVNNHPSFPG